MVLSYNIFCPMSRQNIFGGIAMARIIDGDKNNIVGQNIKKYRKKNKMSQQKLSNQLELLGVYVCRGSVSRIEDMSRTVTDIELFAISKVLKISVLDLFENVE